MATSVLSIEGSWWAASGYYDWVSASTIYSGNDGNGNYYRSKIAVSTEGLTIQNCKKLVLKVTVDSPASPVGCMGVLTLNNALAPNKVQNSDRSGPHEDLASSAIATSYAYADEAGTTLSGKDIPANSVYYLVFDTTLLVADTTYYIYFIRSTHAYTGTGWCRSQVSAITPTLTYENYTKCTAPTAFSISPAIVETKATLSWSGAKAGTNNAIKGYEIQYADSTNGSTWSNWTTFKSVTGTSTTDIPGISRGVYRKYRIRTLGTAGSSYYSGWKNSDNTIRRNSAPGAPAAASLNVFEYSPGDIINVDWSGASDVDNNIAGYIIGYKVDGSSDWTLLAEVISTMTSCSYNFTPTQVDYQETMRLAIRTVDAFGVMSDWKDAGSLYRNDVPYVHVYGNSGHEVRIPVAYSGGTVDEYMPYVRKDGIWVRHPGIR